MQDHIYICFFKFINFRNITTTTNLGIIMSLYLVSYACVALWRNGSASDSRSEGWVFESLWGQIVFLGKNDICSNLYNIQSILGPNGSILPYKGVFTNKFEYIHFK